MSFVPSSYSIKLSVFVEIPDSAIFVDVTKNSPEFIRDPKLDKSNSMVWENKSPLSCQEDGSWRLFKIRPTQGIWWTQLLLNCVGHGRSFGFNCPKFVLEQDEDSYNFAGVVSFHYDKFCFDTLTKEQYRCLIFIFWLKARPWLLPRTRRLKFMEGTARKDQRRNRDSKSHARFNSDWFWHQVHASGVQNLCICASIRTICGTDESFC